MIAVVSDGDDELTVDELARRAGMTVRNVRAHQSRGLLPAPALRGRTGFYGAEHLERLELIKSLQADGFNLESIRRLLDAAGGSTSEVLRFTHAVRTSFDDEQPRVVDVAELAERYGGPDADPALLQRAVELGLLRPLGDGRYEERSPALARAGAELARLGIGTAAALDVIDTLRAHADGVARAYVELFMEHVWGPFEAAGEPAERWPEVREALERLRPLAAESLVAVFGIVMRERAEEALEEQLERHAARERRAS
jgi:DNA-binding transcriptional MerR regulator